MKRRTGHIRVIIWCICSALAYSVIAISAIAIAHSAVFRRADYEEYNTDKYLLYTDLEESKYSREEIKIPSGQNILTGYLYGTNSEQGLIVVSPGHRDPNDVKLYEIMYFVDAGWMVLCYDYTGCYNSEGSSMVDYTQSVHDLDAVLNYVEVNVRFQGLPVMLFGHSLGAYASAAVLQYGHDVSAAVIASGFDMPAEQWEYSIERYTGAFHYLLLPYTKLFITLNYGDEANLSAVDGINVTDIPVLVISGTDDVYYGGASPIYEKQEKIVNPNCSFRLMEEPGHCAHYEYFLTDAALAYQKQADSGLVEGRIDKSLYAEHDIAFMDSLHTFYLSAINEN